jgi:hypothetical protein
MYTAVGTYSFTQDDYRALAMQSTSLLGFVRLVQVLQEQDLSYRHKYKSIRLMGLVQILQRNDMTLQQ